jgi:tagatose-1,6-bisphosphate aldolase
MHCATEIYPHVAVATDMRNSLMFELERVSGEVPRTEGIIRIKECIADVFAPYVDCYLIDPIYGMGIFEKYRGRKKFICALEVSDGFTYDRKHRFPRLIPELDLKDLKTAGIIAVKLLVYFNVDDDGVSDKKIEFAKTVSQSCAAQGLQVIFEPVLYDMRNDCERNDSIRLEMAKKLADLVSPMRCFIAGFMLETPISTSDLSDEMVANEIHRYFSS